MNEQKRQAELVISRGRDGKLESETHSVPFEQGASVLDALMWIKTERDPTLAFRFSCINANVCRECTMLIDGKVTYACTTRLTERSIRVEPLPSKKHLRDLITATVPGRERLDPDQAD